MKLEQTADGSYTLYVPELDEHYHSVKGALTESQHIFIEMGLKHSPVSEPHILEIGLGTGLNAFLKQLDYPRLIGKQHEEDYYAIHRAPWNTETEVSPWFTLHKIEDDFTRLFNPEEGSRPAVPLYDIIYFDAFAPEKQPEMWEQSLFDTLYKVLNEGGILTTYCAKGVVRRMLQTAGFTVERLPGPPGGKREILRATKSD